jgi:EAL domain-containing protein (putative c-di-GMP-specific phosphodiesterase class I)
MTRETVAAMPNTNQAPPLAQPRAPIDIGKVRINVDASIGIACCPRDGGDPDALRWPSRYHLALNLSPAPFKGSQLVALVLTILADEGMPPERLEIEITESALMGDFDVARAVLADFRRAGLRMSLDDFGTGYSSLQHLRELKVDKLKIDRSFVLSMASCNESAKIVDAIIALSSNLGMTTVAEGVETAELARTLTAKGCDYAQGYCFGKAMAAREIDALLNVDRAANEARLQRLVEPV